MPNRLTEKIMQSKAWKSIFRTGFPESNFDKSRLIFNNFFFHVFPVKVRRESLKFSATFYLGITAFALFVLLVITGIYLMLYYHPSVPQAYRDMKDLEFVVSSGKFIRNFHRWAAHGMVAVAFFHLLRVFYAGAYRPPKQFNWVVGVVLFLLTLLLSYTGYLLPWDQLALWGISVGTNMLGYAPVLGEKLR
ncbi:MAG: cytochrome b N-terminal domain-containing protein, partial [bacterium]